MRVLIDTNILISYLLNPRRASSIAEVVHALAESKFTLIVPESLVTELLLTVTKPRLAARIASQDLADLLLLVQGSSEFVVLPNAMLPYASRDPKDNYLLTAALIGQADYLVTGDKDLLTLAGQVPVAIISPAAFVALLEAEST